MSDYTSNAMHRYDLVNCKECGCYYCLSTFQPTEITRWCDVDSDGIGLTAICPRCGIDAVIGVRNGEIDAGYLKRMHADSFGDAGKP